MRRYRAMSCLMVLLLVTVLAACGSSKSGSKSGSSGSSTTASKPGTKPLSYFEQTLQKLYVGSNTTPQTGAVLKPAPGKHIAVIPYGLSSIREPRLRRGVQGSGQQDGLEGNRL